MDVSSLDVVAAAKRGAEMDLLHPGTGAKTGIKISVLGFDHPDVVEASRQAAKDLMGKAADLEVGLSARRVASAKAAVTAVSGMEMGDRPIKTPQDLAPILDDPGYTWMVDQIVSFAGDRASFFPKTPLN